MIQEKIGYPDYIKNDTALNLDYEHVQYLIILFSLRSVVATGDVHACQGKTHQPQAAWWDSYSKLLQADALPHVMYHIFWEKGHLLNDQLATINLLKIFRITFNAF